MYVSLHVYIIYIYINIYVYMYVYMYAYIISIYNIYIYIYIYIYIFSSYTMGTKGLPDIYTQSPRAAGPRVYISGEPQVHMV